jgi:cyclophilin family peptidyl-prolyl cis-trans isomerase
MWDRILTGRSRAARPGGGAAGRLGRRWPGLPLLESLEERQLLASAALAPISNLTVPAQQGYTQPLDGSATTDPQTFTVTSSNPDIPASVISGPIWTLNVTYTDPTNSQNDFSGPLVFQLIDSAGGQTLTNATVNMIHQFTTDGYYSSSGNPSTGNKGIWITRIAPGFPNQTDYIVQGGAPTSSGTAGNSGEPGTPFANQNFQQLAFTGTDQLAMANAGGTNSNDTQFFITTGSPNSVLEYKYTIFGQMIPNPTSSTTPSDQTTLAKLTQIPKNPNPNNPSEISSPKYPPTYTASITAQPPTGQAVYPSGSLLIDTTQAKQGETTTITVTAHDPTSNTSVTQSFTVTAGAYGSVTNPFINFRPFANPVTATAAQSQTASITLNGKSGYPNTSATSVLTYALVSQPAHGTITNFNPTTGTLNYTPSPGFTGTDTFSYQVTAAPPTGGGANVQSGPNGQPVSQTSNAGTVTITVSPTPPVHTGAVRQVDTVLLITPLPQWNRQATNTIDVVQTTNSSGSDIIEVFVNGQLDSTEPLVSSIDSIVVFGSKANERVTIDPSVTIPSLLDGGHGGRNILKGGAVETREHGWFGLNRLIGGTGPNQLIGRVGHVKFNPSSATDLIFAGHPNPRKPLLFPTPPSGTFFVYKKGRLIPVPLSNLYPSTSAPVIPTPVSAPRRKK